MAGRGQHAAGRREQVLDLLRSAGDAMSINLIAEGLGIHANTVRFHLETLVSNGQVERTTAETGTLGRPPLLFRPVRGMDPMGPRHYRGLAEALVATLATEIEPGRRGLEAGRAWGSVRAASQSEAAADASTDPVDNLVQMLDEMGFAPERPGVDASQIALHHCPFLELAVDRPDVVCPVHLGLMQGAMETWDSPVTAGRLDPFVRPDLCVVHLRPRIPVES